FSAGEHDRLSDVVDVDHLPDSARAVPRHPARCGDRAMDQTLGERGPRAIDDRRPQNHVLERRLPRVALDHALDGDLRRHVMLHERYIAVIAQDDLRTLGDWKYAYHGGRTVHGYRAREHEAADTLDAAGREQPPGARDVGLDRPYIGALGRLRIAGRVAILHPLPRKVEHHVDALGGMHE